MRNWNSEELGKKLLKEFGCEPTYEELKPRMRVKPANPRTALRAYLWGIETPLYPHLLSQLFLVASLPMRNWNKDFILQKVRESTSCEPTYEELKRIILNCKLTNKKSCEPTYEELKRKKDPFGWFMENCCEPTYEELKLSISAVPINICESVASLPMRNWNFFQVTCFQFKNGGCEPTYEELKLSFLFSTSSLVKGCEPTYEELKPSFATQRKIETIRLRAYLWGIET